MSFLRNLQESHAQILVMSWIIPGLTDLHLHAPQYTFRASGMDLELLDWLNTYTFPQEARYEDTEFAKEAYLFSLRI